LKLSANEQAGLAAFVDRLRSHYGSRLVQVVLFGSKARGDADAESDLDLLILLETRGLSHRANWNAIADLAWDVELEYGLALSFILKAPADYAIMQRDGLLLARNIEQDGIVLWTSKPSVPTLLRASRERMTTS
jgi:uncharacterized protein